MIKDLVIVVPDKNAQFVINGLLPRCDAFQIDPVEFDIYIHPERDPGVYHKAANLLLPLQNLYKYAIVFLDYEGSGQENKTVEQIGEKIKSNLERNGWQGRCDVIVFNPELEIWAWTHSPHLANNLGWQGIADLKTFLHQQGFWQQDSPKPDRPKEAIESALRVKRIQRSSAIYKKIATQVSFKKCTDPSFIKFKHTLFKWFAAGESN